MAFPFLPYSESGANVNETTVSATTEAMFPNIRDAIDLLKSPLFHDFIALFAAFQTTDKADDKAAFEKLLTDAGYPEMAGLVEPLFDLITILSGQFTPNADNSDGLIRVGGIGGHGIHWLAVVRMRHDAARDAAIQTGKSFRECYDAAQDTVTATAMASAMMTAGVPVEAFSVAIEDGKVGALFDGHIIQQIQDWIATHPEQWAAIKKIFLALILALIGM